jgi:methyl-accepting chemotaxis protein
MFRSLRTQLIAISVSIVVLAMATVALSNYLTTRKYVLDSVDQQTVGLASRSAAGITEWLDAKRAATAAIKAAAAQPDPVALLKTLEQAGQFDMTYIARPDKSVIFSEQRERAPGYDPTQRAWYLGAARSGRAIISAPYIGASNGKLLITFADPIGTPDQLEAVVGADVLLDTVVTNVLSVKPTPHSFAFLVDGSGKVIAYPDQSMTLQPLTKLNASLTGDRLAELAHTQHSGAVRFNDRDGMLYVHPIGGSDWLLAIVLDRQEATASLAAILTGSVIETLVLVLLAAGLLFALIAKPMRRLEAVRDAIIASGDGDFTHRLAIQGDDELTHITTAFNRFADNIATVLHRIRMASESVRTASQEIAAGNLDLSARTERQASALNETASSIDKLTGTVKENADSACRADQLAASASDAAIKGGSVVSQVVDVMGSINTSSRKIVDIISVIDEIAFRTNILALNAAVEAARAGEQGKGFAVVAGEVRSLAQRSAQAAKEVKNLIENSVQQIDGGSELVKQAGDTMTEIVEGVQRVTGIMNRITQASQEQTTDIEQVNRVIIQVDGDAQKNAALVEQAAAAADSLQEQAAHLAQAVSVFRLRESVEA